MSHNRNLSLWLAIGSAVIGIAIAAGAGCSQGAGPSIAPEPVGVTQSALGSVNVLTRSYDNQRTGANTNETILTQANVKASTFGKIWQARVDDAVFAQILYASGVHVGSSVVNVAYVATMNNSIYAFNADNGNEVWPHRNFNNGQSPPRWTQTGNGTCENSFAGNNGHDGILGTPVIDGNATPPMMYFVSYTTDGNTPPNNTYRLNALDITTGNPRQTPVIIGASGFLASWEKQRPGLALSNGFIYIGFTEMCETVPPFRSGWMLSYNSSTLQQVAVLPTTNANQGGVWQSGGAPAIDSSGNVYFATGNGNFNGTTDFGETLLKRAPGTLAALSFFTPFDWSTLSAADLDLGVGGPSLFPGSNSVLVVQPSKTGKVYLTAQANLGGLGTGSDGQIAQVLQASANNAESHGLVLWQSPPPNGVNLYVWGDSGNGDTLNAFHFQNTNRFSTSPFAQVQPTSGGIISLSANGSTAGTGIVWAVGPMGDRCTPGDASCTPVHRVLYALEAEQHLGTLWSSNGPLPDDIQVGAYWAPPTVANGKVFVPTFSGMVAGFGLKPDGHGPSSTSNQISAFPGTGGLPSVVYSDNSGDVSVITGSLWQDLVQATGGPKAASPGNVSAFDFNAQGTREVMYVGATDGHIYELFTFNSTWGVADLSKAASALNFLPASGSAISGYSWESKGQKQVAYLTSDGHVHLLYVALSGGHWTHIDVTGSVAGAPSARLDSPLIGYAWETGPTQQIVYLTSDGKIQELYTFSGAGGWANGSLTDVAAGCASDRSDCKATGLQLAAYPFEAGKSKQVEYLTSQGDINELYIISGSGWQHADLTQRVVPQPSPANPLSPIAGFAWERGVAKQIEYVSNNDGHLHELSNTNFGAWVDTDLSASNTSSAPLNCNQLAGSTLTGMTTSSKYIACAGITNLHIYAVNPPPSDSLQDLTNSSSAGDHW